MKLSALWCRTRIEIVDQKIIILVAGIHLHRVMSVVGLALVAPTVPLPLSLLQTLNSMVLAMNSPRCIVCSMLCCHNLISPWHVILDRCG